MQRGSSFGRRLVLALLLSLPAAACTDELPTLSGDEFFPGGVRPSTFEVVVPAERFLRELGEFTGFTGPQDAEYLLVAHRFGGVLEAHTLARVADFPVSVTYSQEGESKTDSVFTFVGGSVLAPLDSAASALDGPVRLQLWELAQEWDYGTVSWELAVDTAGVRVPWATPGGTRGALLSEVVLSSVRDADTLRFPLDTTVLRRISRKEVPGFLVTATGGSGRIQLSDGVRLRADVRPQGAARDTVIQVNVGAAGNGQTFVFTPEPPVSPFAWEAGGIRSARTLFRVDLDMRVPGCASGCPDLPLDSVTLNEVSLLLRPVPVPQGFRPLAPVPLLVRRVVEPELGRRAPLGDVVNEVIGRGPGGSLLFGGSSLAPEDSLLAVPITAFVMQLVADTTAGSTRTATLALLGEPEGASFGPAWFAGSPRLRIVYTVPERPTQR